MIDKITWAPRVSRDKIKRLYESDAKNIQDNELIDEVGYGLYARAESFIKTNRAHNNGIIDCPACNDEIHAANNLYACECGWHISTKEYHATYKGKQLVGYAVVPFAEKFIADWERAKDSYSDKMRAIDYLIHTFHHELTENTTRPAAINFIEGKIGTIIELIFELAYGYDASVYNEQLERWLANAQKSPWLRDGINEKAKELKYKDKLK
jgi:hypothetical protein